MGRLELRTPQAARVRSGSGPTRPSCALKVFPALGRAAEGGRSYQKHYLCLHKEVCAFCESSGDLGQGWISFLLTHHHPVLFNLHPECVLSLFQAAYTAFWEAWHAVIVCLIS